MDIVLLAIGIISVMMLLILIILTAKNRGRSNDNANFDQIRRDILDEMRLARQENSKSTQDSIKSLSDMLVTSQEQSSGLQDKRLSELTQQLSSSNETLRKTISEIAQQNEQRLESVRSMVETRLKSMQEDNTKQIDKMRETVDEKLQKTLDERISQSFKLVSERLEQVYKGLGEMQTLASGVGDLKKVLSGVKTRGILGEIQLGAILEQILSPEQYETNKCVKPGSREAVEYAVCLPGDENGFVYLPIDSKFPADTYSNLLDAYETGDVDAINIAILNLERNIKLSAKTIHDKYISTPHTTDFAIMFLPFEGLYSEVVRRGMIEVLQRDYKISIAGPTTMAALLNSLQMGFKTLAVQKRSGEVWAVLGAVKSEFDKFGDVLTATQMRLEQANKELDKLVGVRTRQIRSKLSKISSFSDTQKDSQLLFEDVSDDGDI